MLFVVKALSNSASSQHCHRCLGMVLGVVCSSRVVQVTNSVQLPILVGLWVMLRALVRKG